MPGMPPGTPGIQCRSATVAAARGAATATAAEATTAAATAVEATAAAAAAFGHGVHAGAHRIGLCRAAAAVVTAIDRAAKLRTQVGISAGLAFAVLAGAAGSTSAALARAL